MILPLEESDSSENRNFLDHNIATVDVGDTCCENAQMQGTITFVVFTLVTIFVLLFLHVKVFSSPFTASENDAFLIDFYSFQDRVFI